MHGSHITGGGTSIGLIHDSIVILTELIDSYSAASSNKRMTIL